MIREGEARSSVKRASPIPSNKQLPCWCRIDFSLAVQLVLTVLTVGIVIHDAGGSPFLTVRARDIWTQVALSTVLALLHAQWGVALAHALFKYKGRRIVR